MLLFLPFPLMGNKKKSSSDRNNFAACALQWKGYSTSVSISVFFSLAPTLTLVWNYRRVHTACSLIPLVWLLFLWVLMDPSSHTAVKFALPPPCAALMAFRKEYKKGSQDACVSVVLSIFIVAFHRLHLLNVPFRVSCRLSFGSVTSWS